MALLPVEDALNQILNFAPHDNISHSAETIALEKAAGRILATDISANLTHPPASVSIMDGYAVRQSDLTADSTTNSKAAALPLRLKCIGESAAGHPFANQIAARETVRIFTGAVLPPGADMVVIQEDTEREGDVITITAPIATLAEQSFTRAEGADFKSGEIILKAGQKLTARDLMLAASANHAALKVARQPKIAILATGDELLPPGSTPEDGQIISSIPYGLAAMVEREGGVPQHLGIAKDTPESLASALAKASDADIIVTIGGASQGDHDLVHQALSAYGVTFNFWKIAMRPGKPLMFGRKETQHIIGLPGNPVSALICAQIFILPLIRKLMGAIRVVDQPIFARTQTALASNGPRQHYMRALYQPPSAEAEHHLPSVTPSASQDSGLQSLLSQANCLLIRPPHAKELPAGSLVPILPLNAI